MFKTNLKNTPIKLGKKSILLEALQAFRKLFSSVKAKELRDKYGRIGFDLGTVYLVAKKSTYGDIVSVHKNIWDRAMKEKKAIVMYLRRSGYFYRFDPVDIKETSINERGEIKRVNFSIREGKNLMKLQAERERLKKVIGKNVDYFNKKLNPEEEHKIYLA